eukprot:CAMPEP_0201694290 /NCGR_PEP_ID=MMETSP0578-20130828/6611_1 /ASSEMBLY_ACC=CAM_ASM_000663 /TAXON_ID=267565 /ORGANISM="Skeletonema grethea, Strain CCMP 1804" /LENGTH=30 /DNA_ID= /DNA_START= /DNA_END= /DNA_ORIENTATION=
MTRNNVMLAYNIYYGHVTDDALDPDDESCR